VDSGTEVRYGGVVVGRSPQVRDRTDAGAFIVFAEPMPVGTSIAFKIDEKEQFGRVTDVIESADAATAGMRVRFESAAERRSPAPAHRAAPPAAAAPAPAAAAAAPEPAPAAPPAAQPAPAAAAAPVAQAEAPVPVAAEASSGSQGVPSAADSQAHSIDTNAPNAPNAPHHDGEGGRRRRRRK
jgi:hypothetical protein